MVQTDAYQVGIMYLSVVIAVIVGLCFSGGFGPVFQSASDGGRLIFFK